MFAHVITKVQKSAYLQPLQYLATMRVAIAVCEAEDMQEMMRSFRKPGRTVPFTDDQWGLLRCEGRRKLHQIGVPDRIVDIVLENLWTISFEVFKWMSYHAEDTDIDSSPAFCWTPRFAIDYVKTAEMLTINEKLDTKKRFKLACIYCLEADLRSLWRRMSLSERRFFFVRGNLEEPDQNLIILYWTYYIQDVPLDFWACEALKHKKLFKYAVENGYLSATRYFYNKLETMHIRNCNILKIFSFFSLKLLEPDATVKEHLAIFCFLICQLPPKYVTDTCFPEFDLIFLYFLEWPWQKHFMTVVDQLRGRISKYTFELLLRAIFEKEMKGSKDHDYKGLFMEFWLRSPENCKTYVNTECVTGYNMLKRFALKHFGFVFEEQSFSLKKKFREDVFEQNGSDEPNFEQKNVEFFRFLIRAQVATREKVQKYSISYRYPNWETCFCPLGELLYLIDGLIRNV